MCGSVFSPPSFNSSTIFQDHILKCCKAENIKTLVDDQLKGDITISPQPNKALYLEISPAKKLPKRPIMRSARVGLHMNKASVPGDIQKHFVFKVCFFEQVHSLQAISSLHSTLLLPTAVSLLHSRQEDQQGSRAGHPPARIRRQDAW